MEAILHNMKPSQQKKFGSWLKIVLTVVAALVVLGIGFAACAPNPPFRLGIVVQRMDASTGERLTDFTEVLTINQDGSVVGSLDDGLRHTFTGRLSDGTDYTKTMVFHGSGTYDSKTGKLTYTRTITSIDYVLSTGDTCGLSSPFVDERLVGIFSGSDTITGTYSSESCTVPPIHGNTSVGIDSETGNWIGTTL